MSNETFKVGDRVEVIYVPEIQYLFAQPGWRGVITGPLIKNAHGLHVHSIEYDDGKRAHILPRCIRKIDDGEDSETLDTAEPSKVSRWTDCLWRPKGVRA